MRMSSFNSVSEGSRVLCASVFYMVDAFLLSTWHASVTMRRNPQIFLPNYGVDHENDDNSDDSQTM